MPTILSYTGYAYWVFSRQGPTGRAAIIERKYNGRGLGRRPMLETWSSLMAAFAEL